MPEKDSPLTLKEFCAQIFLSIFEVSLGFYLLLLLLETLKTGWVSYFFNLNKLLYWVAFWGLVSIFYPAKEKWQFKKNRLLVLLGLLSLIFIAAIVFQFQGQKYLLFIVLGVLIIIIAWLMLNIYRQQD